MQKWTVVAPTVWSSHEYRILEYLNHPNPYFVTPISGRVTIKSKRFWNTMKLLQNILNQIFII